jgi:HEAT repeat protein
VFAAMLNATKSKQENVRAAALMALGKSANACAVRTFVQIAARGSMPDRRIARDGLYALSGPAVNDTIIAMVPAADSRAKVELLAALAARRVSSAVPVLLHEANDRNPGVRTEAAKALRPLARLEDLPALVNLLVNAKEAQERKEWETTVVVVARKGSDQVRRVDPILSAYNSASGKQARISLLTVLGKIDAPASLDALRKALKDNDADIRLTAIRGLSAWPTPDPADDLWAVAQHSTVATHRAVALRGFVRLLGLESTRPADETVALYKSALALAPNLDERKRLLSSMADAQVPTALLVASESMDDPQIRTEAELVTVRIAENIMGSYRNEVIPRLTRVAGKAQNPTAVQRAKELLTLAQQFDDYLTTWEYAGPYIKEGAALFSTAFPPEEQDAAGIQWKFFPAGRNSQKPWLLEFDKVIGGENRVVYLRNKVWSDSVRKVVLELGSDDGIKFWLNGELVHANDADRRVNPGDDVLEMTLKQGWNTMMMKVNQRSGEWGACVRLRAPRETPKLQGIRVARVNEQ